MSNKNNNDLKTQILMNKTFIKHNNEKKFNFIFEQIHSNITINSHTDIIPNNFINAVNFDHIYKNNITHILNVNDSNYCPPAGIMYLYNPFKDTLTENIFEYLLNSINFIDLCIISGGNIIVHCQAGISRSVSIVIAYLIWKYYLTFDCALDIIKKKRPIAKPNENFIKQLLLFEKITHKYEKNFNIKIIINECKSLEMNEYK
jgi:protein-tyrosine phosphatase